MAEPTNINISIVNTLTSLQPTAVNYLTALALQNTNTVISSGYNLQWSIINPSVISFTLSVAYIPSNGSGSSASINIPYNVTNFVLNTPTRYSLIDTVTPITSNIYSNITNSKIFPPVTTSLSQNATSVQVEFSANYSSINFAPTNIQISAVAIDNKPFIRSLTAVIMQNTGSGVFPAQGMGNVRWTFNQPVWATTLNKQPYQPNTVAPVSSIGTMIFYTSATTYDFTTESFTLCSSNITATSNINNSNDTYTFIYDTFPIIDLNLFVNFENSNNHPYFYRQTSSQNYIVNLNTESQQYNFSNNFTDNNYIGWYTVNNSNNKIFNLTPQLSLNRTLPSSSSVNVFLSAFTPSNSLSSWFSSHISSQTLTTIFVTNFLSADFIGFPGTYFKTANNLAQLDFTNYKDSLGMFFYGEGHTDFIYLCALPQQNTLSYNWEINDTNQTFQYPFSAIVNNTPTNILLQPLTSIYLQLSSDTNTSLRLPVSLHVVGNNFSINDPKFFYNDNTGNKSYYPYYISTANVNDYSLENTTNNQYRESILVKPYDPVLFEFVPGISEITYLPPDESLVSFQASFKITPIFLRCYDKYGLIWKWSTFENCSASPTTFTNKPSTWTTTQCETQAGTWPPVPGAPGAFPKKWRNEGPLSASLFLTNPIECTATNISWILSSSTNWPFETIIDNTGLNNFIYTLNVKDFGRDFGTVSKFEPTYVTIAARQTVTCFISAISPYTQTNDWKPKTTLIEAISTTKAITTPDLLIYTPNKYILTGTEVILENLITQKELITALKIDFDNSISLHLTGNDINTSHFFLTGFNTTGNKDVKMTAFTTIKASPIIKNFPNLLEVVNVYDEVSPVNYQEIDAETNLPWPQQPNVGSNDWVTSDNINQCFKKFYDNLEYLQNRVRVYNSTFTDFYGFLGTKPISAISPTNCLLWTWEDVDCLNTSLPYTVTWSDVLSVEVIEQQQENSFVDCGTWEDHYLDILTFTANCFGKYEVEWNWRSRKCQNSSTPITWKQTKCEEIFAKKWFYEPSQNNTLILCDEGVWNVNIPGINEHYQNIQNSYIQPRCIYYGIVVSNNNLFLAQKTQIKALSSDYNATYYDNRNTLDGAKGFSNLKNICVDSKNRFFILDSLLNEVACFEYIPDNLGDKWQLFTSWGGFGGPASKNKFQSPNDIHVDQLDNIWVTDTGNNCVKHYSNTGTWLNTIILNNSLTPISVSVDSNQNIHILTNKSIEIYTYNGNFVQTYSFTKNINSLSIPRKIISSFNREILYVIFNNAVIKFFKNGVFAGTIIKNTDNIKNITGGYHDEYRNLYITTDDKVLKYADLMTINTLRGELPSKYWNIEHILIHEEEYVQNWVYTKSFQRMWDNIELFRNILLYSNKSNKQYIAPEYKKDKMIVGQNEIVTSSVINRVLDMLWANFTSLLLYYKP